MKKVNLILVLSLTVCTLAQAKSFKEILEEMKIPTEASSHSKEAAAKIMAAVQAFTESMSEKLTAQANSSQIVDLQTKINVLESDWNTAKYDIVSELVQIKTNIDHVQNATVKGFQKLANQP